MIKNLSKKDSNKAVKFMNKVFHKKFRKLLPKIYKENNFSDTHYVYEEGDKILGAIANLPVNFRYKNTVINCRGIGMVSVSKKARGKGIMSKMVNHCIKINQEDTDLMFLTGNRQRYEFFGFVPSGQEYKFFLFKHNVNKIKIKNDYRFLPLEKNPDFLDKIKASYQSQSAKFERDDDKFLDVLNSWNNRTYIVLKNDEYFGYLNATKFIWNIQEVIIEKAENLKEMLASLFLQKKLLVMYLTLPYFQPDYLRIMQSFADKYAEVTNCNIKIVNFKSTIEKLLNIKSKYTKLLDGRMILEIDKVNYLIEVENNICKVKITNEEADYKFNESEATTFLMSKKGLIYSDALINNYFPLPFTVPHIDNV